MKHTTVLFFLLLVILRPVGAHGTGRSKKDAPASGPAQIRFIPFTPLSLQPLVLKYYPFYSLNRGDLDAVTIAPEVRGTAATFQVPADHPVYISINPKNSDASLLELYLVQPGTTILIREDKGALHFEGKDAALFRCQFDLRNIRWQSRRPSDAGKGDRYQALVKALHISDSLYAEKRHVLTVYKKLLSRSSYNILKADCLGLTYYNLCGDMYLSLRIAHGDTALIQPVIRFYNNYLRAMPSGSFSGDAVYSRTLADGLLEKTRLQLRTQAGIAQPENNPADPFRLCSQIQETYSGALGEKIQLLALEHLPDTDPQTPQVLAHALAQFREPYFKNAAVQFMNRIAGAPAYAFALEDGHGNMIHLSDFKGKTIVLKFWTAGCPFCEALERRMKEIRELVQNDTGIVFMDVCVDDKAQWQKGLATGLYADPQAVNVYLSGQGSEHPLLRQYGYDAFPALLIIDGAGYVVSSRPDRPFGEAATVAFLHLLRE